MASARCIAQPTEGVEIGARGSIGGSLHSAALPVFGGSPFCGVFESGTGTAGAAGVRITFPSPFDGIRLRGGATAEFGSTLLRATPPAPLLIYEPTQVTHVEIGHEYRLERKTRTMLLDLCAVIPVAGPLHATAGAWFGYGTTIKISQSDYITDDYSFEGGMRARNMPAAPGSNHDRIETGPTVGLGYRIDLRRGWSLQPDISTRIDLLPAPDGSPRRFLTADFGLELRYDLSPHAVPETPTEPEPLQASTTDETPRGADRITQPISASLDIFAVDSTGRRLGEATVELYETRYSLTMPADSGLAWSGGAFYELHALLPAEEAERFHPDSLAAMSATEAERNRLNVTGYRLKNTADGRLDLIVPNGGTERRPARAAADSARDYLIDRFGLTENRVRVMEERRGGETGDEIILRYMPSSITDPIKATATSQRFSPPLIRIDPIYGSGAGIRSWEITLRHDDRLLGRFGSNVTGSGELNWRIGASENELSPLVAELSVIDSTGNSAAVTTRTPLRLRRSVRTIEREIREGGASEFIRLTPFRGEGRTEPATPKEVAAVLREGATVTIVWPENEEQLARDWADRLRSIIPSSLDNITLRHSPGPIEIQIEQPIP